MSKVRLSQRRRVFNKLSKALTLPDPMHSYEDWAELQDPGQDLAGADRLELRLAWQAAELALLLDDREQVLYMDSQGNPITARAYLLKRLAVIKRLWRGAAV